MYENEHPLWLGSVCPSPSTSSTWNSERLAKLYDIVVRSGRPLVLIGRNSGSSGRAGAREAAKNLTEAAEGLFLRTGFDVRTLLPSVDELVEILMASPNVVKSQDSKGRSFKNRFALLDYSDHGFIVSFSTGSAHKIDAELKQPHVRWIQRLMRDLEPAGFFASQYNRVTRVMWQTGLLIEELKNLEARAGSVWACDDQYGEWSTSEDAGIMHAVRGQQASTEAKEFRRKAENGQIRQTGDTMLDGLVHYAISGGVPPGLFSFRDRRTNRMFLSIDSPGYYLDSDEVLYGLPSVRDAEGEFVDQAETVRWFLREYAQPGVALPEVFRGLVERRFSTHALRKKRDQGPAAYYGGETKPVETYASDACQAWVRSIFSNLDLYETGVLRRSIGPDEHQRVVITGVFPDAGTWGSPEDFQRIRSKLATDRKRHDSSRRWSWSGMPVEIDGVQGCLKPRRARTSAGDVGWNLCVPGERPANPKVGAEGSGANVPVGESVGVDADAKDEVFGRRLVIPAIPDRLLTASIVDALIRADGRPLIRHLSAEPAGDAVDAARRDLDQLCAEREAKVVARERCLELMVNDDSSGPLLARLQAKFDDLDVLVKGLDRKVESARRRVDAAAAVRVGVDVTAMSALVTGLKDPNSNRHRADLREAVRDLEVTTTRVERAGFKGITVTVSGRLAFDVDGERFDLPFQFSYDDGVAFDVDDRALKALGSLREGRVARFVRDGATHDSSVLVAGLLGVDSIQFALSACHDPKLLQLGMAVVFPDPAPGEDPADVVSVDGLCSDPAFVDDFDDVAALAEHMGSVYGSLRGRQWLQVPGGLYETLALIKMAGDASPMACAGPEEVKGVKHFRINVRRDSNRGPRWTFARGMWPTLSPCRFCGGTAAAAVRIREIRGYLCLNPECRRDEAGVRWPARFDQYISRPQMWLNAGFVLTLPDGFDENAKKMKGDKRDLVVSRVTKWRKLADLDDSERAEIMAAYEDRTRIVKEIMATFRLGPDTLYDIVAASGVQPRHPGKARWQKDDPADRIDSPEERRAARRPAVQSGAAGTGRGRPKKAA